MSSGWRAVSHRLYFERDWVEQASCPGAMGNPLPLNARPRLNRSHWGFAGLPDRRAVFIGPADSEAARDAAS